MSAPTKIYGDDFADKVRKDCPQVVREIPSIACVLDCKTVILTYPFLDSVVVGIVYEVVFRDTFCEQQPMLHKRGCLLAINRERAPDAVVREVLNLSGEDVIYAYSDENQLVVVVEDCAGKVFEKVLGEQVDCSKLNIFCVGNLAELRHAVA